MNDLIDPRPMEPDYVRDMRPDPSGMIEWRVYTRHFDHESKMYESRTEYHEGTPLEFISHVAHRTLSPIFEPCDITADARQVTNVPDSLLKVKHLDDGTLYWRVKYEREDGGGGEEEGSDMCEGMDWLIYLMKEQVKFTLDLDVVDPTPAYMEIGSMF